MRKPVRVIDPEFMHADFLNSIEDCGALLDLPSTRILLEGRNRIGVVRTSGKDGRPVDVVVKEFRTRGVDRLKTLVRSSKGIRAWWGAEILVKMGLPTPRPIASLEVQGRCFVDQSFFLSEEVKDAIEIRTLFQEKPREDLRPLLKSLALYLRRVHEKGILHRDLSDGNILVRSEDAEAFTFIMIDTDRVRFRKTLGFLQRVKNLIRLGVPKELQSDFLTHYFGGRTDRKLLRVWYRFNKSTFSGYIALKRKLKLRKLARKLGIQ